MSVILNNSTARVFYLNFVQIGSSNADIIKNKCEATQEFNFSNLVEEQGEYLIAIERLIIPIQKIPFHDSIVPAMTLTTIINGFQRTVNSTTSFSLIEFLVNLNLEFSTNAVNLFIYLNPSGRIIIRYDDWANTNVTLDQTIADIFDMNTNLTIADSDANGKVIGNSPVFDRFDQLDKIQIEILGANIQQEIINTNISLPVLTDLTIQTSYSANVVINETNTDLINNFSAINDEIAFGYSTRQNVIYTAEAERRYVNLSGKTPIQNLTLQCVAIFKNQTRNIITLPPRTTFSAKIAFFKK